MLFGLGARTTIIVAGIGSLAGGLLATLTDSLAVVGVAYLVLGFMISAAAPAGFSLTEDIDEDPTSAIAAVTTVGYTGFIWSPPLLGYVAQTIDLRAAMAVIVVATVGIIAAGLLAPRTPASSARRTRRETWNAADSGPSDLPPAGNDRSNRAEGTPPREQREPRAATAATCRSSDGRE